MNFGSLPVIFMIENLTLVELSSATLVEHDSSPEHKPRDTIFVM